MGTPFYVSHEYLELRLKREKNQIRQGMDCAKVSSIYARARRQSHLVPGRRMSWKKRFTQPDLATNLPVRLKPMLK